MLGKLLGVTTALAWGFTLGHTVKHILKGEWFDAIVICIVLATVAYHWFKGLDRVLTTNP